MLQKALSVVRNLNLNFDHPILVYYLRYVWAAFTLISRFLFPCLFEQTLEKRSSWRMELEREDSYVNLATRFDRENKDEIMKLLSRKTTLKKLDLSFNLIDNLELSFILKSIQDPLADLEILHLKSTYFDSEGFRTLSDFVKKSNRLESLNLKSNYYLKNSGATILDLLQHSKTLQKLNLQHTSLTGHDIKRIAEGLKSNHVLKSLNLAENLIEDEGAYDIAESLKMNSSLTKLVLNSNKIRENGALHLTNALKHNSSLKELDFHFNNIGENGGKYFGSMLLVNNTLEKLNILGCKVRYEGILSIIEALKRNHVVRKINLFYNDFGPQGVTELLKVFPNNPFLIDMKIDDKEYGDKKELKTLIEGNLNRNRENHGIHLKFSSIPCQKKSQDIFFRFR